MNLRLDRCSYLAAKTAVTKWHYSRTMPVGKMVRYGVWENDVFKGCVIFSRGATPNIGKPYDMQQTEICELTRVALDTHATPVTKILSIALRMLRKSNPGIKLVVSYADVDQGHEGKIYRAGNWIYAGLTNADTRTGFVIHGRKIHNKTVHSKGVVQSLAEVRRRLDPNATEFISKGKHKFLMPLTNETHSMIMRQSSSSRTTPFHGGNGGANPTLTLQKSHG